jgi:hypothetical protein
MRSSFGLLFMMAVIFFISQSENAFAQKGNPNGSVSADLVQNVVPNKGKLYAGGTFSVVAVLPASCKMKTITTSVRRLVVENGQNTSVSITPVTMYYPNDTNAGDWAIGDLIDLPAGEYIVHTRMAYEQTIAGVTTIEMIERSEQVSVT